MSNLTLEQKITRLLEPEVRRFLTKPIVIDWLQWAEFKEDMRRPDYPQVSLSLLAEYAAYVARLEKLVAAIPGIITTLTDINNAAGTVNFSSHTQMKEGINAAVELSECELARLSKVVEEIES